MEKKRAEMLLPAAWMSESQSLVDLMAEQEKIMGRTEQREMLVFLHGVAFGRTLSSNQPADQQARSSA